MKLLLSPSPFMNFSIVVLLISSYVAMLLPRTEAKLLMKVVFDDDGMSHQHDHSSDPCNDNDAEIIKKTIGALERSGDDDEDDDDRRRLGRFLRIGMSPSAEQGQRNTGTLSRRCHDACAGYVGRRCYLTECRSNWRRVEEKQSLIPFGKDRVLDDSDDSGDDDRNKLKCEEGLEILDKEFNSLISRLSESCRPVVQHMRNVTCIDDTRFAAIDSFTLWNSDSDTIVKELLQDGDSFCYTTKNLNIEAVANTCVDNIQLRLVGPFRLGRSQSGEGPYTMFGHNDGSEHDLKGRKLPIGTYSMSTVLPGSDVPAAKVTFTIKKC